MTKSLYTQDVSGCLADRVGAGGLAAADLDGLLEAAGPALGRLRAAHADGSLPLLRLPERRDDLAAVAEVADRFREAFDDVVVLGTGGSSLGGLALLALADPGPGASRDGPAVHFLENIDPATFGPAVDGLLGAGRAARTGVVVVSKSGSTAETVLQSLLAVDALRGSCGEGGVGERMVVVTEPRDSPLGLLADRFGMRRLDHDPGVGGRFAALSVVGLLPAMIAGLDPERVRAGAASVLGPVLAGAAAGDAPPAVGAAVSVGLARHAGVAASVMMPYADRLAMFARWWRQLWAESLGKGGNGTTPVAALGAVDQHSQLQLYLDGPPDKMLSLVLTDCRGRGAPAAADLAAIDGLAYLEGRTVGDLLDAEGRATVETLVRSGRPTRTLRVGQPDEGTLGALMMHFMLETIVAADLLGVDAFDQPAVEDGKARAREHLSGAG